MLFTTAFDAAMWRVAGERCRLQNQVRAMSYEMQSLRRDNQELAERNYELSLRAKASQKLFTSLMQQIAVEKALESKNIEQAAIDAVLRTMEQELPRE